MKKIKQILLFSCLSLTLSSACANTTDSNKDNKKTVIVCVDVKDSKGQVVKDSKGNVKQNCKEMKVHKKLEGTKVPGR